MRHIIKQNCKPTDNKNLKFIMYYNNPRSFNLVSRNNMNKSVDKLSKTNMVYKYILALSGLRNPRRMLCWEYDLHISTQNHLSSEARKY